MVYKQLIGQLQRTIENESIILKTINKMKELSIYPAVPVWTVPLGNQVVDERKHLFIYFN